jgi:hypothetical protein
VEDKVRSQFSKIVPADYGVILAIRPDGNLLWYKHQNYADGISLTGTGVFAQRVPVWQGGVQIGLGWNAFRQVPMTPTPPGIN